MTPLSLVSFCSANGLSYMHVTVFIGQRVIKEAVIRPIKHVGNKDNLTPESLNFFATG